MMAPSAASSMRSSLLVGRERHRRLEQRLARDHDVAAGQVLAEPPQIDTREDDLGARRADVDADARQRDVVLDPERVVLERSVDLEIVVVVIGIAVVDMRQVLPVHVVLQGVAGFRVVAVTRHAPSVPVPKFVHTCRPPHANFGTKGTLASV